jgi:hypothetical protein
LGLRAENKADQNTAQKGPSKKLMIDDCRLMIEGILSIL